MKNLRADELVVGSRFAIPQQVGILEVTEVTAHSDGQVVVTVYEQKEMYRHFHLLGFQNDMLLVHVD